MKSPVWWHEVTKVASPYVRFGIEVVVPVLVCGVLFLVGIAILLAMVHLMAIVGLAVFDFFAWIAPETSGRIWRVRPPINGECNG